MRQGTEPGIDVGSYGALSRTRSLDDREAGDDSVRVECLPLYQALIQAGVQRVDALKIDVEGVEPTILNPFFRDAPEPLWPRFMIIEDTGGMWQTDLFPELGARLWRRIAQQAECRR